MIYKDLSVALLTFILRFLNGGHRRRRGADFAARRLLRAAHRHGRHHAKKRSKKDARATLDPERVRRTGGDPGAGPSNVAAPAAPPQQPPAPRQDRWVRPPSPSSERVAERLRESETQQPLRPMRYCPLHGWGPCPARQPRAPPTDADTAAPVVRSSGLLVQVTSPARPRARTRLTARKSTGPRGRLVGHIASTSTAAVAVDATSSSFDDERIALVLGDGVQQRLPTPTPDDGPSGTVSPPALLSLSGNRVVRRLAHHLSPRPSAPGSWSATARPSDDDVRERSRSRSPPRRLP
ncbi:hypothetical protein Zm00014a_002205 [Zea mays]|uniref:Uncharacterized protein n=1 Tax=Zea mays TaxID=4577 RepID=A0A3L6DKM0_MAIZE|nr:hypothetical protein Zm00014a_002205 [Zea mays]